MLACARYIKEIGRGKDHPRSLSYDDAKTLWQAVLSEQVAELELGAILIAMRIKGESVDELAGFLDACAEVQVKLAMPPSCPVVIPSYNGARNLPNLTPLLACLLARRGIPVLVHGKETDDYDVTALTSTTTMRTTSAEIFAAMGLPIAAHIQDVHTHWQANSGLPIFIPIQVLHPALARILVLRRRLGVRGSAHSLVKMLQPFDGKALRLASHTHPEYQRLLTAYYEHYAGGLLGDVLLARGTEGEVVAHLRRAVQIDWFHDRGCTVLAEKQDADQTPFSCQPSDATTTANWIQARLADPQSIPASIARQVAAILQVLRSNGSSEVF